MSVAASQTIDQNELQQILKEFNMDNLQDLADVFSGGQYSRIKAELAELKGKLEKAELKGKLENAELKGKLENAELKGKLEKAELNGKLEKAELMAKNAELMTNIERMRADNAEAQLKLLSERKG
jgi:hypothetical protein